MQLKTWASGPGIGTLDSRYVKLTGSNTPMTGPLGLSVGSVTAPGLYLAGSIGTGIYLPFSNVLGFTAGGKDVVQMAASSGGDSTWSTQRDFYILPGAGFGYNGYELLVGSPTLAIQAGFSVITGSASTGSAQFSFRVGTGLTIGTSLRSDYLYAQTLWAVSGPNGNQMIYCYAPYFTHDFDHPLATDTEIYVQASVDPDITNNEWGMFRHNRTDFEVYSGAYTGAGTATGSVTADSTTDTFTKSSHGLTNGCKVIIGGSVIPTGLSSVTEYFVISATTNTFQISLTAGGAAVDFTTNGTSVTVSQVVRNDIVLSPRGTEQLRVSTGSNAVSIAGWVTEKQNSVAAANDFTATSDSIYITGATQINRIAPPPYSSTNSTHLTLIFASNPVVKHNQATGSGFNAILLAGSADFSTAANSVLYLVWDSVNSVWQEVSRKSA